MENISNRRFKSKQLSNLSISVSSNLFFHTLPFLIISIFIFSCSKITHSKSDEEQEREIILKNKTKQIAVYQVSFRAGVPLKEQLFQLKEYDRNGYKTRQIDYGTEGQIICILKCEYDRTGNLISTTALHRDSSLLFHETRSYDNNNNRKELHFYLPDGTYKYRNVANYDTNGLMTELAWYWPIGLRAKNKFKYQDRKKTEDVEYAPDGKFNYKWIYKYDSHDHITEAIQYYPGNKISAKIEYHYNPLNQLDEQVNYFGESIENKLTFRYNNKDLLIEKSDFSHGNYLTTMYRFEYETY